MKVIKITLFFTLLVFLLSCNNHKQNKELSFVEVNEFQIQVNSIFLIPITSQISKNKVKLPMTLVFQNLKSKKAVFFYFDGKSLKLVTNLKYDLHNLFCNLFFSSSDSIYSFQNNTNNLYLKNNFGKILKKYQIPEKYTPVTNQNSRLTGNNKYLLLGNADKKIGMAKKEERLKYYKNIKPLLLVNINDSTFSYKAIGVFPEKYKKTGDNYLDPTPSACFGFNNRVCVSFGADDNLYVYNDSTLILQKKVKSNFIKKFKPYPDDKMFDMLFMKNYNIEEPKYTEIIYDPWEELYYRIVKLKMDNVRKKSNVDHFWSVIVLDRKLNVIGEKRFSYKFNPHIFIPTPFGILMAQNSNTDANKSIFKLMQIKINE